MKKSLAASLFLSWLLMAYCSKSRNDILPSPEPTPQTPSTHQADTLSQHFSKVNFSVSLPFDGNPQQGTLSLIRVPEQQNATIIFSNFNTAQFTNIKWFVDDVEKGTGNNFDIAFSEMGEHKITFSATTISTGRTFTKNISVYVYKYINISVEATPPGYVCGEIEILGATPVGALPKLTALIDCAKPEKIKFELLKMAIFSNTNSILFIHLFRSDKSVINPVPYALDAFSGSQLNNYTPGVYIVGATTLTIH